MKRIAEQGKEKFLEYHRDIDTIVLSEIVDGKFQILETVEGIYFSCQIYSSAGAAERSTSG